MFLWRLIILSALALAAAPATNQESRSPEEALAKLRTDWAKDLHDKKLDQITALYAQDAVFLPPNGARIAGRAEIRDITKKAMESFTSDLTFQSMNSEFSGDLAYDSGEYRETLTSLSDGSTSRGEGNYLMVLKRQADGNWLIVQQAWTASAIAH